MPKGKAKVRRNGIRSSGHIERVPFQQYTVTAMSGGVLQIAVHPAAFTNSCLQAMSSVYELCRFTKLGYTLRPRASGLGAVSVGYYPDAVVTNPSSQQTAMENLDTIIIQAATFETAPVHHIVPKARLKGQIDWYKASTDAGASEFENQGTLCFFGSGTDPVNCVIHGICEFKNPMDSGTALRLLSKISGSSVPVPPQLQSSNEVLTPGLDSFRAQLRADILSELKTVLSRPLPSSEDESKKRVSLPALTKL